MEIRNKERLTLWMKHLRLRPYAFLCISLMLSSLHVFSQSFVRIDDSGTGNAMAIEVIQTDSFCYEAKLVVHGYYDEIRRSNGESYHKLSFDEGSSTMEIGEPQIPTINQFIKIPSGAKHKTTIEELSWTEIDIGKIYPFQRPLLENESPDAFSINGIVYNDSVYHTSLITESGILNWRLNDLVHISVCPFKYFPSSGKMKVLNEFVMRVDFIYDNPSEEKTDDAWDAESPSFISNALNSEKGNVTNDSRLSMTMRNDSNSYNYLIIVGDLPAILNSNSLQEFRKWKALKGFKNKVVSTNTIGSTPASIKNYITQEYDKGVRYVLLIGDEDKIPIKGFLLYNDSTPVPQQVKSDYWYGCLSGDTDYIQDIPIGRMT